METEWIVKTSTWRFWMVIQWMPCHWESKLKLKMPIFFSSSAKNSNYFSTKSNSLKLSPQIVVHHLNCRFCGNATFGTLSSTGSSLQVNLIPLQLKFECIIHSTLRSSTMGTIFHKMFSLL